MNRGAGATSRSPKKLQSTDAWRAIEADFLAGGQALPAQNALTLAVDEVVVDAYRAVIEPVFKESLAMLAGGIYGLRRTFPYSELDIVLLLESGKQSDELKERLPEMVRVLWNAGLRVNSAVLTVAECLEAVERASVTGFSLLDRRLLAGDPEVLAKFEAKLPAALALHGQKMCQRLCELARARHARFQNTPHHAEPDVKEGPGGLQDVRLIDWLAILKPEHEGRSEELSQAAAFVSSARCFLHYRAGCDHNILDFEAQESLALQAFARGKSTSEWMGEYYQSARTIFNEARRAIEGAEKSQSSLLENFREYRSRLSNQEFTVSRERLLLRNPAQLASDPTLVFRMLEFIGRHGVMPASETERRLEASREVFALLCPAAASLDHAQDYSSRARMPEWHCGRWRPPVCCGACFPNGVPSNTWHRADLAYRYTVGEQVLRTIERVIELGSAPARSASDSRGCFPKSMT